MGYAVLLYFDEQTEQRVLGLRHALIEQGIPSILDQVGDRPHISLAGFANNIDCDILISLVQEFADGVQPFKVQFSAMGIFPSKENVLFLSPTPTLQLLTYHQEFHRLLAKPKLISSPYYVPENWTPHCSVEMNIPDEQLPKAIEICSKVFTPILGQFQEITVIAFPPIKPLATWSLGKRTQ